MAASTTAPGMAPALPFYDMPGQIIPIRADVDRIFRITVCLRPFRAAGPRLEFCASPTHTGPLDLIQPSDQCQQRFT